MNYLLRRPYWGVESCNAIAEAMQEPIEVVRSNRMPSGWEQGYLFRWGTTCTVPNRQPLTIVNKADAIHAGYEKAAARMAFQQAGLFAPETWCNWQDVPRPSEASKYVVRPHTHQESQRLFLVDSVDSLRNAVNACGTGYYVSRYVAKEHEYRVYIVSNRAVAISEKFPDDKAAVSWGGVEGAGWENVQWDNWPLRVAIEACRASALLGYDFCAVDVCTDADGTPFILECNSAPSLTPYPAQCYARAFDYLVRNGKEPFMEVPVHSYREVIHPANLERRFA